MTIAIHYPPTARESFTSGAGCSTNFKSNIEHQSAIDSQMKSNRLFFQSKATFNTSNSVNPVGRMEPVSCYFFISASSTTSIFETALQRCLAISEAKIFSSSDKSSAAVLAGLSSIYDLDSQGQARAAARELMTFIEINICNDALASANNILAEADVSKLSSRSLIGLIRSTSRMRNKLPAWSKTYRKSWDEVCKQGKNPNSIFVGLPNIQELDIATKSK